MNEFVYLYRRPVQPPGSPQQMQDLLARWNTWFADLEKRGHLVLRGQPLENAGGAVVKDEKASFNDGPYAETKDLIVGFSIVRTMNLAEAIVLTKGHPIFDQSGMIEVRPALKFR